MATTTRAQTDEKGQEIDILQAVANQAAVAIENTNLSHEIFAARETLESRKIIDM
jgi:GAF domain-containing protein